MASVLGAVTKPRLFLPFRKPCQSSAERDRADGLSTCRRKAPGRKATSNRFLGAIAMRVLVTHHTCRTLTRSKDCMTERRELASNMAGRGVTAGETANCFEAKGASSAIVDPWRCLLKQHRGDALKS